MTTGDQPENVSYYVHLFKNIKFVINNNIQIPFKRMSYMYINSE